MHWIRIILLRPTLLLMGAAMAAGQSATAPPLQVWQIQESGTTAGLRGIDSVDGTIAWASGTGGTVLKTIDGGAHWQKCAVPDAAKGGATLDFRGVQAWDATTAIVMASGPGDKSRLYKTTDGCKSWTLLFKNPDSPGGFFDSLFFPRMQSTRRDHEGFGLLLGDPTGEGLAVFETRNGGDSWARISSSVLDTLGMSPAAFAASNSCISGFGGSTFDMVIGGRAGSFLLRLNYAGTWWTNDGSTLTRTWEKMSLPMAQNGESAGPFSVAEHVLLPRAQKAAKVEDLRLREVVVGGDFAKPNERVGTASRQDGVRWKVSTTPPHGYRSTVQWSESLKLWITAGTNGSDISRDDGRTWQPLDNGNWNALSLPFLVGPDGRIGRLNPASIPKP
jgi:photosystem II stability/assembly factor-like uncharacterized protein